MAELRETGRLLKTLGEDNRLRIVNLLHKQRVSVTDLCQILDSTQSNVSKHLARLRLTGIVTDKREGQFIYYSLSGQSDHVHGGLVNRVIESLSESETCRRDLSRLNELREAETKDPPRETR
jgi:ArsR family transcriptional regulator